MNLQIGIHTSVAIQVPLLDRTGVFSGGRGPYITSNIWNMRHYTHKNTYIPPWITARIPTGATSDNISYAT